MFYCVTTDQYIQEGQAFVIDGVQYPANWLNLSTPEEKAEIGLEEVVVTNSPGNPQFYYVSTELDGATLTYINTPKDLDECKANQVSQTNSTAYSILLPTDWMVVRAVETQTTVDPAWNAWRESVRQTAADYVAEINACTDIDELAALQQPAWPTQPGA